MNFWTPIDWIAQRGPLRFLPSDSSIVNRRRKIVSGVTRIVYFGGFITGAAIALAGVMVVSVWRNRQNVTAWFVNRPSVRGFNAARRVIRL